MERAKLTIRLPKQRLDEVKAWAHANDVTVTEVIDRDPEVTRFAGILRAGSDPEADYREHLYRKHFGRNKVLPTRNGRDSRSGPVTSQTPEEILATLDG